ncbi:MAG: hypothetical protein WEA31_06105 [Pirellulales bacterium]
MAMAVTGVIALALGSLASAVHSSNEYVQNQATVTQHARVVLERIKRHVETAHASREFPGFLIVPTTSGSYTFPDTLAVWQPLGEPVDAEGLPRVSELIVYTPNPASPNELWEITDRSNHAVVPSLGSTSAWRTMIASLAASNTASVVELTDLVRRSKVNASDTRPRSTIRFEGQQSPSDVQLAAYEAGTADWEDMGWPQSLYGNRAGLRQSWCRIELQLMPPGRRAADGRDSADIATPFFSSAALYYDVEP